MKARPALAVGLLFVAAASSFAQPLDPALYAPLQWRCIGPFRAGRTVGATGVPGKPNLFYVGVNNGGVWKTTDAGRVWKPIFDDQPTGSIGALAVAPSNPNVIYVGSGEGLQRPDLSTGDGVYKTTDGGKTWTNTGLHDGEQISAVIVDPKDENRAFVAVLGHPYGPNAERGVFRTTNGGRTWEKVLYKDVDTGAVALGFDPGNANTVYAVLWAARQGPWENGAWQGLGSGFFKSTDGGTTWKQMTKGLPTTDDGLGRIGFDVSRSDPKRLFAVVDCPRLGGLYRSDDAGESWRRVSGEARVWGRGSDFAEVKIDPKNKDVLYVANVGFYKSTDGGKTFVCFKGAPGGDDYHTVWINPDDPDILLVAADQGAIVTVNGGETWSSWYNQPTAQFYHVITDDQFPYWVYGGQQESGSAGVSSRGNDGQITSRDWHTVGVEEYGYVAPDPLNPDIIFGGKVSKYDRRTGQVQNVSPETARGAYRFLRTAPLVFSTVDKKALYLGANVLFKTTTGGLSWDVISPDLSHPRPEVPVSIGVYRNPQMANQPRRGVIYAIAPSYKEADTIWAGTDDGLIHVTRDGGKHWADVTPPGLTSWSKVSQLDGGRFDADTCYAAINRIRLNDQKPHVYRTHDGGKTWTETVRGLPDNSPVNAVREDPVRKGLLFAGTERAVFVSFNDGDDWQPLRQNMPATSIRDLVVHGSDLVVGTHGRSFWILDDITPLRQLSAKTANDAATLFAPAPAVRVRRNVATDTPLPPDEPLAPNPPDGAPIDYHLKAAAGVVVLEIHDPAGKLVRRYSSNDKPEAVNVNALQIDPRWIRPPQILSAKAGSHRFVWDLHYTPLDGPRSFPISAVWHNTPSGPLGPAVKPGTYTVKLSVDGQSFQQSLAVTMDPRVPTPAAELDRQFNLTMLCYDGALEARKATADIRALRQQLQTVRAKAGAPVAAIDAVEVKAAALEGSGFGGGGRRGGRGGRGGFQSRQPSLGRVSGELGRLMMSLQGSDMTPTTPVVTAVAVARKDLDGLLGRWAEVRDKDLTALNTRLKTAGLPSVNLARK
ncbi:MAG TPA: hypothetical protein VGJ05_07735 [Fimbriiglobus sp.]|jgi:photosystem II stability/assembly factor-like uncharacterized protein